MNSKLGSDKTPDTPIKLKSSSFTLLVIHLFDSKPEVIRRALEEKIAQVPIFLEHASVVINVSNLEKSVNWKYLQQAIISTGLRIIGIVGCNNDSLKTEIDRANLPILTENKNKPSCSVQEINKTVLSSKQKIISGSTSIKKTRFIDVPVHSGQRIYASNSDLIVTSYVNSGAELIADGNIHIYGMMRGRALAGANGDQNAQIFCTHLMAELVSIAGIYWLSDKISAEFYGKSARLRLVKNTLIIQPLS